MVFKNFANFSIFLKKTFNVVVNCENDTHNEKHTKKKQRLMWQIVGVDWIRLM